LAVKFNLRFLAHVSCKSISFLTMKALWSQQINRVDILLHTNNFIPNRYWRLRRR